MRWISWLAVVAVVSTSWEVGCKNNGAEGFFSPDGKCTDGSTADCRARCECKMLGRCKRSGDQCVEVSTGACKASDLCKSIGACTFVKGRCVAGSAADCEQSSFCKIGKACILSGDRCVQPADAAPPSASTTN